MLHPTFIAPRYDGHCFADLPATIQYWLTGQGAPALAPDVLGEYAQQYDTVILFFVDTFGWEFFQRSASTAAFLRRLVQKGRVSKITAQFPSTTAAHVTSIHTGLPVGQSGVYEWQYYEPLLDAVITPLLFSFAGTSKRDELKRVGIAPEALYPAASLYAALAAQGVKSYTFGSREFTPSTYSNVVMRGAEMFSFFTFAEAFLNIAELTNRAAGPTYLFFYSGGIDTMCHFYGPDAIHTRAEIDLFLYALEKWFLPNLRKRKRKVLFVMTADHGHMAVTPENTHYLNVEAGSRKIAPLLRKDQRGNVLPPGGSPRDVFLYVRDEALDDAHALLSNSLAGYADVIKTSDLLNAGYFGKLPVCANLLARLGNLTVLPYAHNCVWWYQEDKFEQRFYGHHGGLTPTEMEIPLALLELT